MARLRGKVAIITGAGSGIGRATAKLFAAEGARLALLDRNGLALGEVARELQAVGSEFLTLEIDLSLGAEAEEAVAQVATRFGQVDILVNNAATFIVRGFSK